MLWLFRAGWMGSDEQGSVRRMTWLENQRRNALFGANNQATPEQTRINRKCSRADQENGCGHR